MGEIRKDVRVVLGSSFGRFGRANANQVNLFRIEVTGITDCRTETGWIAYRHRAAQTGGVPLPQLGRDVGTHWCHQREQGIEGEGNS